MKNGPMINKHLIFYMVWPD